MPKLTRRLAVGLLAGALSLAGLAPLSGPAHASDNAEVEAMANASLDKLYAENSAAAELSKTAAGILIFPKITKAGLGIGGEGDATGYFMLGWP